MKKSVKILLTVLCLIFVGIFAFSGYKLYSIIHEYKVAENKYNDLSSQFVNSDRKKPDSEQSEEDKLANEETSPIDVDFDALREQCADVVGWIYSEDTVINYPMVIAEDNFYYLRRMIDGNYNSSGTLFLDCLNEGDFSSKNTLIYGHNMRDGSMFASIRNYDKQEYYDAHPKLYINTPDGNYRVEIFSGYITDADSDTYTIGFGSDEEYQAYLDKMVSQSAFTSDVKPTSADRIVTLSTCTYEYSDARFVVQGRLVPIN